MSASTANWARAAFMSMACFLAVNAGAQQLTQMPAGITMTSNGLTLEVTALRDDVLRVRMWKGAAAPEDASWAVLPSSRSSTVAVVAEPRGFSTKELRVTVDDQLQLTIADLAGNVMQKDAAPSPMGRSEIQGEQAGHMERPLLRSRRQTRTAGSKERSIHFVEYRLLRLAGVHRSYL